MKLWEKGIEVNKAVEKFTVGRDREVDLFLAPYDVLGSVAHSMMLQSIGLLSQAELNDIKQELRNIYKVITDGKFVIEEGVEDVHSQVELMLTKKLGDTGKKIHSGRSRNDQVLVDLVLFFRDEIKKITQKVQKLFDILISQSEKNKEMLMPGYTHLQAAMPSSFGLWYGAYAEALVDDVILLESAYKIVNQNPLGSAAGYGSSFPLNREMTTRLLGFETMRYNVVNAQMGRGKTEKIITFALGSVAGTLSKMAMDVCLFMNQDFNFVTLPDEFTTGSSIMPHKKNPDVFELIRAKCNKIQALTAEVQSITNNLPSGYFRDYQVLKEILFPAFGELSDCLELAGLMSENMQIKEDILNQEKYKYVFSVEALNKLVLSGMPFRDAYKEMANRIASGDYNPDTEVNHTHEGSIGNLCNNKIKLKMDDALKGFNFQKADKALNELICGK